GLPAVHGRIEIDRRHEALSNLYNRCLTCYTGFDKIAQSQSEESAMTLTRLGLVQAAVLLSAIPALAQNFGSITGSVRDQSGASVPTAAITATNKATGVITRVVSLSDGQYLFTSLIPGAYDLSVEAPGFTRYVRPGIEVHVSDKLTLDIALQVGEVRDAVT